MDFKSPAWGGMQPYGSDGNAAEEEVETQQRAVRPSWGAWFGIGLVAAGVAIISLNR